MNRLRISFLALLIGTGFGCGEELPSNQRPDKINSNKIEPRRNEKRSNNILNDSEIKKLTPAELFSYIFQLNLDPSQRARIAQIDKQFSQTKIEELLDWAATPTIIPAIDMGGGKGTGSLAVEDYSGNSERHGWYKMYFIYDNVSAERQKELRKKWLVRALNAAREKVLIGNKTPKEIEKLPSTHLLIEPFRTGYFYGLKASELVQGPAGKDINLISFVTDYFKGNQIKDNRIKWLVHFFAKGSRGFLPKAEWQLIAQDALRVLAGPEGVNNETDARRILVYDEDISILGF